MLKFIKPDMIDIPYITGLLNELIPDIMPNTRFVLLFFCFCCFDYFFCIYYYA